MYTLRGSQSDLYGEIGLPISVINVLVQMLLILSVIWDTVRDTVALVPTAVIMTAYYNCYLPTLVYTSVQTSYGYISGHTPHARGTWYK